jgi:hypothetical protein
VRGRRGCFEVDDDDLWGLRLGRFRNLPILQRFPGEEGGVRGAKEHLSKHSEEIPQQKTRGELPQI